MIVLAREGLEGMTTRKVADVAGVSIGSLYEYFENKQEVYLAVMERIADDVAGHIKPMIADLVKLPVGEAVYSLIMQAGTVLGENDSRYVHCVRQSMSDFRRLPVKPLLKVLSDLAMRYLTRHPEMTQARNIPAMGYISIYSGIFTVVHHLSDPEPPVSFDELARGIGDMIEAYLQSNMQPAE